MDRVSAMRESHNRSEVREEIMECNRKVDYFPVLFAFPIKVMFGILCTFWHTQIKVGMSLFQSVLSSGKLVGCGHLKYNMCL